MKVRIFFEGQLEIDVPDNTDMDKYLTENAYDLVKELENDPIGVLPESWEEIAEENEKK